jgi:hypothetical protein
MDSLSVLTFIGPDSPQEDLLLKVTPLELHLSSSPHLLLHSKKSGREIKKKFCDKTVNSNPRPEWPGKPVPLTACLIIALYGKSERLERNIVAS